MILTSLIPKIADLFRPFTPPPPRAAAPVEDSLPNVRALSPLHGGPDELLRLDGGRSLYLAGNLPQPGAGRPPAHFPAGVASDGRTWGEAGEPDARLWAGPGEEMLGQAGEEEAGQVGEEEVGQGGEEEAGEVGGEEQGGPGEVGELGGGPGGGPGEGEEEGGPGEEGEDGKEEEEEEEKEQDEGLTDSQREFKSVVKKINSGVLKVTETKLQPVGNSYEAFTAFDNGTQIKMHITAPNSYRTTGIKVILPRGIGERVIWRNYRGEMASPQEAVSIKSLGKEIADRSGKWETVTDGLASEEGVEELVQALWKARDAAGTMVHDWKKVEVK